MSKKEYGTEYLRYDSQNTPTFPKMPKHFFVFSASALFLFAGLMISQKQAETPGAPPSLTKSAIEAFHRAKDKVLEPTIDDVDSLVARKEYSKALKTAEDYVASEEFSKDIGTDPKNLEAPAVSQYLEKARAQLSVAKNDQEKSAAEALVGSGEYAMCDHFYYLDDGAYPMLALRSCLRSVVASEESARLVDNAVAHRQMALALSDLGADEDVVLSHYRAAVGLDSKDSVSFFRIALIRSGDGDSAEAVRNYLAAIAADPDYERAYVNLANEYGYAGQSEKALEAYGKALEICHEYCHVAYHNRAHDEFAAKNYQAALADEDRAIEAAAERGYDYRNAYGGKGNALIQLGDYENAVRYLRLSLNDDSTVAQSDNDWNVSTGESVDLYNLGKAYYFLGDMENARAYAQMSDDMDSNEETQALLDKIPVSENKK